jgi:hypothetical protein
VSGAQNVKLSQWWSSGLWVRIRLVACVLRFSTATQIFFWSDAWGVITAAFEYKCTLGGEGGEGETRRTCCRYRVCT